MAAYFEIVDHDGFVVGSPDIDLKAPVPAVYYESIFYFEDHNQLTRYPTVSLAAYWAMS